MTNVAPDVDPAVRMPAAAAAAAARANGHYEAPAEELGAGVEEIAEQPASEQSFETPAPQAKQAPPPEAADNDDSWRHRYLSMKGRFDQSQEHVARLTSQVTKLQGMLASIDNQPAPAELRPESLLTAQEREEFGDEFLGVVGKKAKEELLPEVSSLKKQVADLTSQLREVTGHVATDARERMYQSMDSSLPQWEKVNAHPDFLAWLRLPDPYSGAIRQNMLNAAFESNDAKRVLAFFNGFLAEEAAVAPVADEAHQAPQEQKIPLERFAAPGRAKAAAASGPTEKPFVTRAQIAKFYADSAAGKYIGRDADYRKTEAMFSAALRDGRVR